MALENDQDLANKGLGFCHHCKQVKNKYLLARCNYNSDKMGHTVPASYTVRDVKIYNSKNLSPLIAVVDISNKASLNHLIKDNLQRHHNVNTKGSQKAGLVLDDEDFVCNRQFCSFCLKTQYEANFIECCKDKSWICPFCQGVCFCTRCLRQDTMTQLKAYFIALGGDLVSLLNGSDSIFDQMILSNFNTHLELTLLTNPELMSKYP